MIAKAIYGSITKHLSINLGFIMGYMNGKMLVVTKVFMYPL